MGIHEGHRERLKESFVKGGLDSMSDFNVLELLLFYSVPRKDTNPIAHALLDHFGSLDVVLEAPIDELKKIPGIGDNSATLLKLIPSISRRYAIAKASYCEIINSSESAGKYLVPFFMYEREEVVYMMTLDAKCKVINCREIGRGSVNTAEISIKKIAEYALAHNASSIILAHNHTSGIALPSAEDELTTLQIKSTLGSMGIALADHIIVAGEDFVSMADNGLL